MAAGSKRKFFFIVNPGSGNNSTDWKGQIESHFSKRAIEFEIFELDETCTEEKLRAAIARFQPERVVAVGGDGTVKTAASGVLNTGTPVAIIPAGSANGMAKELNIPTDVDKAFELAESGEPLAIHLVKVNNEICIHLADIGFNAFVIKKFEASPGRGMWGYVKAAWKVLWRHRKMQVDLQVSGRKLTKDASMIVIANATKYGNGVMINPVGRLDDDVFEIIVVKKISFGEIFKMRVTHLPFDPAKTEVFQTNSLEIRSNANAHFQVDGEYLGRIKAVSANILPRALQVIVPKDAGR